MKQLCVYVNACCFTSLEDVSNFQHRNYRDSETGKDKRKKREARKLYKVYIIQIYTFIFKIQYILYIYSSIPYVRAVKNVNKQITNRGERQRERERTTLQQNLYISMHYLYRERNETVYGCEIISAPRATDAAWPFASCLAVAYILLYTHSPFGQKLENLTKPKRLRREKTEERETEEKSGERERERETLSRRFRPLPPDSSPLLS